MPLLFTLLLLSAAGAQTLDPILPEGAAVRRLATGFGFTEGPLVDANGRLYFTDLRRGEINILDPDQTASNFRTDEDARANGLAFDAQGLLLACEGGLGRVSRTEADGSRTPLAASFAGARFNSPNDLVVAADGAIYFTDPFFGRASDQPQPVQGVYRIAPDGEVRLVAGELDRPNGIALSGNTLYVANDGHGGIRAYDILGDGALAPGADFAAMPGIVDGLAFDAQGHLYAAGGRRNEAEQGIWVFSPQGQHLGTIPVPEMPTNCAFAGRTLYITAGASVYAIDLRIPGAATAARAASWGRVKVDPRF